jgi:hypothetical protein
MVEPADTVCKFFRVIDGTTGAPVNGLTVASFTFTGFKWEPTTTPTTYALGSTITEIGSGYYAWQYLLYSAPAHAGADVIPNNTNYQLLPVVFSGETESADLARILNSVSQPVGGAGTAFAFGSTVTLELVAYRYREVTQGFTNIDLSTAAYNNWRLGIRDNTQAATAWDCLSGKIDGLSITGDNAGNLSIIIPESLIGPVYTTWTASRAYTLGNYVVPTVNNGFVYEATVAGTASGSQPTWPTTTGGTVTDGGVTWTCRLRSIWVASIARVVDDMVRPTTPNGYIYRCTVAGTSAGSEPTWPTAFGGTVTDGGVTWKKQEDPFAALNVGTDTVNLKYEITADKLSTAKTMAIIPSSTLTIKRRENGV